MVHALSEAHRVLRVGGALIDLRPTIINRQVGLELGGARLHIGEIDSSDSIPDHQVADAALVAALTAGKFHAEHRENFEFVTDLDTLEDLQEFADGLHRSVMPESMPGQIKALIEGGASDCLIRIRREMLIARYRKLPAS